MPGGDGALTRIVDALGRPFRLGERLGAGGEGEVHALGPAEAAKILFPRRRTRETHDKVAAMIRRPPPGAHDLVDGFPILTWPTTTLYDGRPSRDRFLGYAMPRIDAARDFVPLYQVSSAARRTAFGQLSWDRLLVLGLRIVHVVRTLHRMEYAVGDLNDRNILVSRRLTPLFLDTDSFEVPRGILGRFPCRVGDRLYWPPELLGEDLQTFAGTRLHSDRYSLAVILFQLLLNGMRPYQSRGRLVEPLGTLEEKTLAGHYPWARPRRGLLEPPAGAPRYESVPAPLRRLFEHAFVEGHHRPRRRPTAEEWYVALRRVVHDGFEDCARRPTHRYASSLPACPWCKDPHDPFRPTASARPRRPATGPHPAAAWTGRLRNPLLPAA